MQGRKLQQAEMNYDRNYDNYDECGLRYRNFEFRQNAKIQEALAVNHVGQG